MSLGSALTTAVSGLNAQSRALGAISDNIANSQTSGYKRIETAFSTLLTVSNAREHQPGGVMSRPVHTNDIAGPVQQTSLGTNLAISGSGYFAVSRVTGFSPTGAPIFDSAPLYTRAGDFGLDANGYLRNSAGYYLNAWAVDPTTGTVQRNSLTQVQVADLRASPKATSEIVYNANLPSSPDTNLDTDPATAGVQFAPSSVQYYDALGQVHTLNLTWSNDPATDPTTWTLTVSSPEPGVTISPATTTVEFNLLDDTATGAKAGSILSMGGTAGGVGSDALFGLNITLPGLPTPQSLDLNFGKFGKADQLTRLTGTDVAFRSAPQDGLPPGTYQGMEIDEQGRVTLNYDNGARKTLFQIPLAQFASYDGLKPENGNAYSPTLESGAPAMQGAGSNGVGGFVPSAVEGSNVDTAAEFTKMIQTQRAYSANTRVITVTAQLLEETNNMVR